MSKRLYKVLKKDLRSPFKDFQYEMGKQYTCIDFDTSNIECSRGFYATPIEGIPYSWNTKSNLGIYEVEVDGVSKEFSIYKQRYEKQTILREIPLEEVLVTAQQEEGRLGYLLSKVICPVNPLLLRVSEVEEKHIELLKVWASVWASVRASVGDSVRASVWASVWASVGASVWASVRESVCASVWASVGDSVRASVWDSVGDSVRDSVWASVWAYNSSLFPCVKKWEYVDHLPEINPFQSCIDLWNSGFVPSFDGKVWRLHSGKDDKIVWEGKL